MSDTEKAYLPTIPVSAKLHYRLRRHLLDAGGTISDFVRDAVTERLDRLHATDTKGGTDGTGRAKHRRTATP